MGMDIFEFFFRVLGCVMVCMLRGEERREQRAPRAVSSPGWPGGCWPGRPDRGHTHRGENRGLDTGQSGTRPHPGPHAYRQTGPDDSENGIKNICLFFSRDTDTLWSLAAGTGHWAVAQGRSCGPGSGRAGADGRAGSDWTLSGHRALADTEASGGMCGLGGRDRDQGLPMYWNLLDQSTSVHCVQHTGQHTE